MTDKTDKGAWRYSINYGPEGEANYANVYDDQGDLVGNFKIRHAIAVVRGANAIDRLESAERALRASMRAAELAIFVVRKQGVMPNSSWSAGFKKDMDAALAHQQKYGGKTDADN
ncbi:hypothetical protein [Pararhizobium haloflavum]|uniref:hypothetical protein n=1 Tax=Pararhizobium haloflavum TaxID=2037914 RepID=UPI000C1969E1|nr:hypothetical protein [Pararhizobium haloflavum]